MPPEELELELSRLQRELLQVVINRVRAQGQLAELTRREAVLEARQAQLEEVLRRLSPHARRAG